MPHSIQMVSFMIYQLKQNIYLTHWVWEQESSTPAKEKCRLFHFKSIYFIIVVVYFFDSTAIK
jgi:hypothetical protein